MKDKLKADAENPTKFSHKLKYIQKKTAILN